MTTNEDEFAVLLEGVNKIEADLAKNLLAGAGIPSMTQGPDFDMAELGRASHDMVRGQDLCVPAAALQRARAVLDEAWGTEEERKAEPDR